MLEFAAMLGIALGMASLIVAFFTYGIESRKSLNAWENKE
jgi:hypothetical protein